MDEGGFSSGNESDDDDMQAIIAATLGTGIVVLPKKEPRMVKVDEIKY